jgi:protein-tyrosine-phosphatase/DNA-binding transcriptional ArsR family regulator
MGDVDTALRRRAAIHAALGEPVRLAIADRLTLGDASPGELGADLDVPTNLLAHHLKTLQEAGVIRRVRSEGDRRRSYVQLVLDDPLVARLISAVDPFAPEGAAPRVVFVCTHNSARSQLAAATWKQISSVPVASAGTHPAARVHPRAVRIARRHGLHLDQAGTAHIDQTARPGDLLVAVCDNAHEELPTEETGSAAGLPGGRLHWAVPDPAAADTDEAFEAAYQQIVGRVDRLAEALTAGGRRAPAQRAPAEAIPATPGSRPHPGGTRP